MSLIRILILALCLGLFTFVGCQKNLPPPPITQVNGEAVLGLAKILTRFLYAAANQEFFPSGQVAETEDHQFYVYDGNNIVGDPLQAIHFPMNSLNEVQIYEIPNYQGPNTFRYFANTTVALVPETVYPKRAGGACSAVVMATNPNPEMTGMASIRRAHIRHPDGTEESFAVTLKTKAAPEACPGTIVDYLYYPGGEMALQEATKANGCSLHVANAYKPNGLMYCYDAENGEGQSIHSIR